MKYEVIIEETLSKSVEVEENDITDALERVKQMYKNEEVVLDSSDFQDVNFYISEIVKPSEFEIKIREWIHKNPKIAFWKAILVAISPALIGLLIGILTLCFM